MRTRLACILISIAAVSTAAAQEPCPAPLVSEALVTDANTTLFLTLAEPARIDTDMPIAGSVAVEASSHAVTVEATPGSRRRLMFTLPRTYEAGTAIQYALTTITLNCTATLPVSGVTQVQRNPQAIEALLERIAYAKTTDEKNVFASFVAARGEGGSAGGAADIIVNRDLTAGGLPTVGALFDTAFTTIRIKKTSAENADPRLFDASVTLQKTLLLGAAREYLLACSGAQSDGACATALERTDSGLTSFFRTFLFDEALRLESDAFAFESVNFVTDTHVQLGSVAKSVGRLGYFSLRLHFGAEIGRSLQKPTLAIGTSGVSTAGVDWIRRGKGGVEATFRFLPRDNSGRSWTVELTAQGVARRLFNDEVFLEQVTNVENETIPTRVAIGRGTKNWAQVEARVFIFSTPDARYGVRLSYMNGSLPPAFKRTNGVQFGFVIETADDESDGSPATPGR